MALQMKENCETCDVSLAYHGDAYICSFECSYCSDCATSTHNMICPNCGGDLQKRPSRAAEQ